MLLGRSTRSLCRLLIATATLGLFYLIIQSSCIQESIHIAASPLSKSVTKALVVASLTTDDTRWIYEHLPDWEVKRYVVDAPYPPLVVPVNKGREAMVYLSYIIDNYDNLPDIVTFIHSQRYQWHNDDPLYDSTVPLRNLQLSHVISEGFVNLRCTWTFGCPSEINLTDPFGDPLMPAQMAFPAAFSQLFPHDPAPSIVATPCCAQFAVTCSTIRSRPRADYLRYRAWLVNTELDDYTSGRIFEYSWHMIFGMPPVYCKAADTCYCKVFGLCGLKCEEEGICEQRWPLPLSNALPAGWPTVGWWGESRDERVLEIIRWEADGQATRGMEVDGPGIA